jgi:probable phosphoglycerate mutase
MLFFYIRHGDPIYDPDSLTELGKKQADAVSKRLALYGIDKIYASSSNRAIQTAKPTCEILKKDMEILDFANEQHAWDELNVERDGRKRWICDDPGMKELFTDESLLASGHKWYEYPGLSEYKAGIERISENTVELFKSLGYERIDKTGKYKVLKHNDDRVALFAHAGFGMGFLSEVLCIPYPVFATHFDICHTGMTVIEFKEENGFAIPKVLTLSSDSHLYREGLPTKYNNVVYF